MKTTEASVKPSEEPLKTTVNPEKPKDSTPENVGTRPEKVMNKTKKSSRKKRQLDKKSSPVPTAAATTKLHPLPVPQYTMGAGNNLGLSLMLHSQVDKYFLTSGTFEGFKVSPFFQDRSLISQILEICLISSDSMYFTEIFCAKI